MKREILDEGYLGNGMMLGIDIEVALLGKLEEENGFWRLTY